MATDTYTGHNSTGQRDPIVLGGPGEDLGGTYTETDQKKIKCASVRHEDHRFDIFLDIQQPALNI